MKPERDDPNRDPQQTLPPRHSEPPRRIIVPEPGKDPAAATKERRLKLGTRSKVVPAPPPDQQEPEISVSVQRGFTLGPDPHADKAPVIQPKPGVQRWILFVAAGAVVLLMMAFLLRPSSGGNTEAGAHKRLMSQYTKYLETNGQKNSVNVKEREKEVLSRLQAITWARALGDKVALESELSGLLFLDNDKNSPLYQYSVSQLKQLGPLKKTAGL